MTARAIAAVWFVCLAAPVLHGQVVAPAKMAFDVASVKENKTEGRSSSNFPLGPGAMYSPNGGTFTATNFPLSVYIMFAYKMTDHEVQALQKQLPSWAIEGRYDIEARTEKHDATKDEMRLMMQSLLAERLKLAVHTTTEETNVYALTLARPGKLGAGLRPHAADDTSCSNDVPGAPAQGEAEKSRTVAGGFPSICGGAAAVPPTHLGRIAAGYRNVAISLIALQMTGMGGLDRPVVDQTGLEGKYDYVIEFTPEMPPGASAPSTYDADGPRFREALMDQTGLKLVPQKSAVEVIVVDHIERPSAN